MRLDVICNDGSPLGVHLSDVYGESGKLGVGGAELALLTMCEGWHHAGHEVRLYNDPTIPNGSPFIQLPIDSFVPQEDRDVVIVFRSPNRRLSGAKGLKVWWSCDQNTVGNFRDFSREIDKIVTISPFHAEHFRIAYGIVDTISIDLPVRINDYLGHMTDKVPHSMIFCSVPDRGLDILANAYPSIKAQVPDATLVITSDYRLWGAPYTGSEQFIRRFLGADGVRYLGAVPRMEMVKEQLKAEIQSYPCTYDELFCYSVAECQVAGAFPVTSSQGALETTNMGDKLVGNSRDPHWLPTFVEQVVFDLTRNDLNVLQEEVSSKAKERFSLDNILAQWEKRVFNG
jgi:glycosyltransferase involved in cell wall biosynthesis